MPAEDSHLSDQIHSQSHWPDRLRSGAAGTGCLTIDVHGQQNVTPGSDADDVASCRYATRPDWPGDPAKRQDACSCALVVLLDSGRQINRMA
jgi:hypothetical protein